jgi:hypothetical protein
MPSRFAGRKEASSPQWWCRPKVNSHHILWQRNLLYTAITRARRLVMLVGDPKAIAVAVRNDKVLQRYTALAARLRQSACGQDAAGF